MKRLKLLAATATLVLFIAVPAAHAQSQPAPTGVADCAVKLLGCVSSGGGLSACLLEFATCMAGGSAADGTVVMARRD